MHLSLKPLPKDEPGQHCAIIFYPWSEECRCPGPVSTLLTKESEMEARAKLGRAGKHAPILSGSLLCDVHKTFLEEFLS